MSFSEKSRFYTFMVTPTDDTGEAIDEARLRAYVDWQIAQGARGLTLFASTGGIGSFSEEERMRALEISVDQAAGRVPIMASTGAITTSETVRLSKHAMSMGADSVLVVPISYWFLTDDELFDHYIAVAEAVDGPVGVYNNPFATGVDIQPELIARLHQANDRICFTKESSADMQRIRAIHALTDGAVEVFCGWDVLAVESFAAGAVGWCAGSAALLPAECQEVMDLCLTDGDFGAGRAAATRIAPVLGTIARLGHVRVCHDGLKLRGVSVGRARAPLAPIPDQERQKLSNALSQVLDQQVAAQ